MSSLILVPTNRDSEAFASLFSQNIFEYRQKNPLRYSLLGAYFTFLSHFNLIEWKSGIVKDVLI
jgi:hypothetical protein